jgi:SAM-dependent methyltransferase
VSEAPEPPNRWLAETGGGAGRAYAARFRRLAESGTDVHGEAALVACLVEPGGRVLDAGCGTGRVAIELAARGYDVVGVDLDASMLAEARSTAAHLRWELADLARLDLRGERFAAAVLAGNVMVYLTPGTEARVVARVSAHLAPGGLLVAGFRCDGTVLGLPAYDAACAAAGLRLSDRWAGWDRAPYAGGDYAVSVHVRPPAAGPPP